MSPHRTAILNELDAALLYVVHDWSRSPLEAAESYFDYYTELPQPLRYWQRKHRKQADKMLSKATSTASKLFGSIDEPRFYSLHLEDFNLPDKPGVNELLQKVEPDNPRYLWQNVPFWQLLITRSFENELFWKVEANSSRVCIHVIAGDNAGLLHLPRPENGEKVKRISNAAGLLGYLLKPPLSFGKPQPRERLGYNQDEAVKRLAIWIEAKRYYADRGRLQQELTDILHLSKLPC